MRIPQQPNRLSEYCRRESRAWPVSVCNGPQCEVLAGENNPILIKLLLRPLIRFWVADEDDVYRPFRSHRRDLNFGVVDLLQIGGNIFSGLFFQRRGFFANDDVHTRAGGDGGNGQKKAQQDTRSCNRGAEDFPKSPDPTELASVVK